MALLLWKPSYSIWLLSSVCANDGTAIDLASSGAVEFEIQSTRHDFSKLEWLPEYMTDFLSGVSSRPIGLH